MRNACDGAVALPSQIGLLAKSDAADVVIANFGLHYHNQADGPAQYRRTLRALLADLDTFAQSAPGRAAVYREMSHQHFDAPAGDFDTAFVSRDGGFGRGGGESSLVWNGTHPAPPGQLPFPTAPPCNRRLCPLACPAP